MLMMLARRGFLAQALGKLMLMMLASIMSISFRRLELGSTEGQHHEQQLPKVLSKETPEGQHDEHHLPKV